MCSLAIDKDARKEEGGGGGVHKDLVLVANPKVCEKIGTKRYTQEFFFLPT